MRRAPFLLLTLGALTLGLLIGGCTYPKTGRFAVPQLVINADSAEQAIDNVIFDETRARVDDTSCPDDVVARVGNTFLCTYLSKQPGVYRASVRVTQVHGDAVAFSITLAGP